MEQPPSIGRIVVYQNQPLHNSKTILPHTLPAIIVAVNGDGTCNLQVFTDSKLGTAYHSSVPYDVLQEHGTWHWPTRI